MAVFAVRKANTPSRLCGIRAKANSTSHPPGPIRYSCLFLREAAASRITLIPKAESPEMWVCASSCVPGIDFLLNAPRVFSEQEIFCEGAAPGAQQKLLGGASPAEQGNAHCDPGSLTESTAGQTLRLPLGLHFMFLNKQLHVNKGNGWKELLC